MTSRMLPRLAALLLASLAAACSSPGFDNGNQASPLVEAGKVAADMLSRSRAAPVAAGGQDIALLNRAALAGETRPMMLGAIETTGAVATLTLSRENDGYQTFASPDIITVTVKGGVLSATRGLAGDLLAGETDATLAALHARRADEYPKALRFIGGERQILLSRLSCAMSVVGPEEIEVLERKHATTHMAEICTDTAGGVMRNDFWVGTDNTLWQSRQFLHPLLGYMTMQRLIR